MTMDRVHMMTDLEIASNLKMAGEMVDGLRWRLDFFEAQKQTSYNMEQAEAAQRLMEKYQHQQKVYAAEVYRREQELMGELMDDYMDSQRNL